MNTVERLVTENFELRDKIKELEKTISLKDVDIQALRRIAVALDMNEYTHPENIANEVIRLLKK